MNTDSERKMTMRFHTAILFQTRNCACAMLLWLVAGGAIAGFVAYSESAAAQVDSLEDFCDLLMVGGRDGPSCAALASAGMDAAVRYSPEAMPWRVLSGEAAGDRVLTSAGLGDRSRSCLQLRLADDVVLQGFSLRLRVSSERSFDFFEIHLLSGPDYSWLSTVARLAGIWRWQQRSYGDFDQRFTETVRGVEFCYTKDGTVSRGDDLVSLYDLELQIESVVGPEDPSDSVADFCDVVMVGGRSGPGCAALDVDETGARARYFPLSKPWRLIRGEADGDWALASARIGDNARSCLQLPLAEDQQLRGFSARWRVDSEWCYDFLSIYLRRADQPTVRELLTADQNTDRSSRRVLQYSGPRGWSSFHYEVGDSTSSPVSMLEFCYTKDGTRSYGLDMAAVDNINLDLASVAPGPDTDTPVVGDPPVPDVRTPLAWLLLREGAGTLVQSDPQQAVITTFSLLVVDEQGLAVTLDGPLEVQLSAVAEVTTVLEWDLSAVSRGGRNVGVGAVTPVLSVGAGVATAMLRVGTSGRLDGLVLRMSLGAGVSETDVQIVAAAGGPVRDLVQLSIVRPVTPPIPEAQIPSALKLQLDVSDELLRQGQLVATMSLIVVDQYGEQLLGSVADGLITQVLLQATASESNTELIWYPPDRDELSNSAGMGFAELGVNMVGRSRLDGLRLSMRLVAGAGSSRIYVNASTVSGLRLRSSELLLSLSDPEARIPSALQLYISGSDELLQQPGQLVMATMSLVVVDQYGDQLLGSAVGRLRTRVLLRATASDPNTELRWYPPDRDERSNRGGLALAELAVNMVGRSRLDGLRLGMRLGGGAVSSSIQVNASTIRGLRLGSSAVQLSLSGPDSVPLYDPIADFCDLVMVGGSGGASCAALAAVEATDARVSYSPASRPWRVVQGETEDDLALGSAVINGLESSCLQLRLVDSLRLQGFSLRWRINSENSFDHFRIYLLSGPDYSWQTGVARISGIWDWQQRSYSNFDLPEGTVKGVEFCYTKDRSISLGDDMVSLDDLELQVRPVPVDEPDDYTDLVTDFCDLVMVGGQYGPGCAALAVDETGARARYSPVSKPWRLIRGEFEDDWALSSAQIGDSASSCLQLPLAEDRTLRGFAVRWRVDSEWCYDFMSIYLRRADRPDVRELLTADQSSVRSSPQVLHYSGRRDWSSFRYSERNSVSSPVSMLEFCYTKDATRESGQDLVAVDSIDLHLVDVLPPEPNLRQPYALQLMQDGGGSLVQTDPQRFVTTGLSFVVLDEGGMPLEVVPEEVAVRLSAFVVSAVEGLELRLDLTAVGGGVLHGVGSVTTVTVVLRAGDSARVNGLVLGMRLGADTASATVYVDALADGLLSAGLGLSLSRPEPVYDPVADFCDLVMVGGSGGASCAALATVAAADATNARVSYRPEGIPWRVVPSQVEGDPALASAEIGNGGSSCLQLRLVDSLRLQGFSLRWQVSSEQNYDYFRIYLLAGQDFAWRNSIARISGIRGWQSRNYSNFEQLFEGTVRGVEFCYTKDGSFARGDDTVSLDRLELQVQPVAEPEDYSGPVTNFCDLVMVGGRSGAGCAALAVDENGDRVRYSPPSKAWRLIRGESEDDWALASAEIWHGASSCLQLPLTKERQLRGFAMRWRSASEWRHDFLSIYLRREAQPDLRELLTADQSSNWSSPQAKHFSGIQDWSWFRYEEPNSITSPVSMLEFCYTKSLIGVGGQDLVAVDSIDLQLGDVVSVPEPPAPDLRKPPHALRLLHEGDGGLVQTDPQQFVTTSLSFVVLDEDGLPLESVPNEVVVRLSAFGVSSVEELELRWDLTSIGGGTLQGIGSVTTVAVVLRAGDSARVTGLVLGMRLGADTASATVYVDVLADGLLSDGLGLSLRRPPEPPASDLRRPAHALRLLHEGDGSLVQTDPQQFVTTSLSFVVLDEDGLPLESVPNEVVVRLSAFTESSGEDLELRWDLTSIGGGVLQGIGSVTTVAVVLRAGDSARVAGLVLGMRLGADTASATVHVDVLADGLLSDGLGLSLRRPPDPRSPFALQLLSGDTRLFMQTDQQQILTSTFSLVVLDQQYRPLERALKQPLRLSAIASEPGTELKWELSAIGESVVGGVGAATAMLDVGDSGRLDGLILGMRLAADASSSTVSVEVSGMGLEGTGLKLMLVRPAQPPEPPPAPEPRSPFALQLLSGDTRLFMQTDQQQILTSTFSLVVLDQQYRPLERALKQPLRLSAIASDPGTELKWELSAIGEEVVGGVGAATAMLNVGDSGRLDGLILGMRLAADANSSTVSVEVSGMGLEGTSLQLMLVRPVPLPEPPPAPEPWSPFALQLLSGDTRLFMQTDQQQILTSTFSLVVLDQQYRPLERALKQPLRLSAIASEPGTELKWELSAIGEEVVGGVGAATAMLNVGDSGRLDGLILGMRLAADANSSTVSVEVSGMGLEGTSLQLMLVRPVPLPEPPPAPEPRSPFALQLLSGDTRLFMQTDQQQILTSTFSLVVLDQQYRPLERALKQPLRLSAIASEPGTELKWELSAIGEEVVGGVGAATAMLDVGDSGRLDGLILGMRLAADASSSTVSVEVSGMGLEGTGLKLMLVRPALPPELPPAPEPRSPFALQLLSGDTRLFMQTDQQQILTSTFSLVVLDQQYRPLERALKQPLRLSAIASEPGTELKWELSAIGEEVVGGVGAATAMLNVGDSGRLDGLILGMRLAADANSSTVSVEVSGMGLEGTSLQLMLVRPVPLPEPPPAPEPRSPFALQLLSGDTRLFMQTDQQQILTSTFSLVVLDQQYRPLERALDQPLRLSAIASEPGTELKWELSAIGEEVVGGVGAATAMLNVGDSGRLDGLILGMRLAADASSSTVSVTVSGMGLEGADLELMLVRPALPPELPPAPEPRSPFALQLLSGDTRLFMQTDQQQILTSTFSLVVLDQQYRPLERALDQPLRLSAVASEPGTELKWELTAIGEEVVGGVGAATAMLDVGDSGRLDGLILGMRLAADAGSSTVSVTVSGMGLEGADLELTLVRPAPPPRNPFALQLLSGDTRLFMQMNQQQILTSTFSLVVLDQQYQPLERALDQLVRLSAVASDPGTELKWDLTAIGEEVVGGVGAATAMLNVGDSGRLDGLILGMRLAADADGSTVSITVDAVDLKGDDIQLSLQRAVAISVSEFCDLVMVGGSSGDACALLARDESGATVRYEPNELPWQVYDHGSGKLIRSPSADADTPVCLRLDVVSGQILSGFSFRYLIDTDAGGAPLLVSVKLPGVEVARAADSVYLGVRVAGIRSFDSRASGVH